MHARYAQSKRWRARTTLGCVTIADRAEGQRTFDRESRSDGEESPDKLPELFDLHVMMFADTSGTAIAALQRAFSIDRRAAERLIRDVPVVVKRAATPEVAAALLDTLQGLGAQVVLLPSAAVAKGITAQPAAASPAAQAAPATPKWGGLDYGHAASAPRASIEFDLPPSVGKAEHAGDVRLAPMASVIPGSARDSLELDTDLVGTGRSNWSAEAQEPIRHREQAAGTPAAIDAGVASSATHDAVAESEIPEFDRSSDLPSSPRVSTPLPRVLASPEADLGLGTVPPLPSISTAAPAQAPARRPTPPPVPGVAMQRGGSAGKRVPPPPPPPPAPIPPAVRSADTNRSQPRTFATSDPAELPVLQLATPLTPPPPRRPPAAEAPATDGYWSGRRGQALAQEPEPGAARPQAPKSVREDSTAIRTAQVEAKAGTPVEAAANSETAPPRAARSIRLSMAQIAGTLIVFYLGIHFDNSVLYGNATPISIALHGVAIYAIGAGVVGLWPR